MPRYNSLTDFLEDQSTEMEGLIAALRHIIKSVLPEAEESLKWNVPFYSLNGPVCYLNPKPEFLELSFVRGVLLNDPSGVLTGDQKQIRKIILPIHEDVPVDILSELLLQAAVLNESIAGDKSKKGTMKW